MSTPQRDVQHVLLDALVGYGFAEGDASAGRMELALQRLDHIDAVQVFEDKQTGELIVKTGPLVFASLLLAHTAVELGGAQHRPSP